MADEPGLSDADSGDDTKFTREDVAGLTTTVLELDAVVTGFVLLLVVIEWSRRRVLSRLEAWLSLHADEEVVPGGTTQYGSIVDETGVIVHLPIAEPRIVGRDHNGIDEHHHPSEEDTSSEDDAMSDDGSEISEEYPLKKSYFQDPRRGIILVPAFIVYGVLAAISTARVSRKLHDETSFWPVVFRLLLGSVAAVLGHASLDDTPLPSFHWFSMNLLPLSGLLSCSLFVAHAATPSSTQNLASTWDRALADMSLVGSCVYMLSFISSTSNEKPSQLKHRVHRGVLAASIAIAAAILRTAAVGDHEDPVTAVVRGLTASGLIAIVVLGIEYAAAGLSTFAVAIMLFIPTTISITIFAALFDTLSPGALWHRAMRKELIDIFLLDMSLSAALDIFRLGLLVKLSALTACWTDSAKNAVALLLAAALGLTKLKDHALDASILIIAGLTAWTLVVFLEYDDYLAHTKKRQPKVTATFAVVPTSSWTTPLLSSSSNQIAPLPFTQHQQTSSGQNNLTRSSSASTSTNSFNSLNSNRRRGSAATSESLLSSLGLEAEEDDDNNSDYAASNPSALNRDDSDDESFEDDESDTESPLTRGAISMPSS